MCDDADEAAQKYAAAGIVMPVTGAVQGIARILPGDLDGADAFFEETIASSVPVVYGNRPELPPRESDPHAFAHLCN
jgi:hypothetical protein